ncbi:MAG TPA: hypothetical protein VMH35_03675 [Streptosporangiaceae bacterium]|nr:hypothetical protein [Streptosporangiaceae bacterium]
MLSRALAIVLAAGLAVVLLLAGGQQVALAGGPGNNGFYGNVTCDQSYSPQCQVTAGSSPSAGTPASPGTQAGGQPPAGTTAGGGTAGGCSGTMNATWGCIPAGCQVTVQTLACPLGVGGVAPPPGNNPAPVLPAPGVLAALARQTLGLPGPVIRSSPAQNALQLTNLPTWLWINPAEWVPESKTATVPGESVTATATPVSVTWHPGDGSAVTCQGAGTPYSSADNPAAASPDCGHTYTSSSAGQPGGAFQATATITWDVTWQGPGGAGGALAPLFTTAVAAFRVAESQALNTSGT